MAPESADDRIRKYEGLIFQTARRLFGKVELDFDDLRQELRIKVWAALEAHDPSRSSLPEERWVFGCLRNYTTDLLRKRRRGELFIEDIAADLPTDVDQRVLPRDRFESMYLSVDGELAYSEVEVETMTLPSTLTERERLVLLHLYRDWQQPNASQVARDLGLSRSQIETTVASLREKLADWRPAGSSDEATVLELPTHPPLPVAA